MSSFFPSSLSSASLAWVRPLTMWSWCLPPVFLSIASAALSTPPAILSPCLSTASVALPLSLSRNPMSLLLCGSWPGRPRRPRPVTTCHTSRMTAAAVPPVVAVVGATASGKTDLSLALAERLGGEIVNTDAMQVYRGMDIGTAKLPTADRRGIPHHLLDVLDIHETASVAEFQRMARAVIEDLRGRGVVPVLVGGSALYTRAVLDRFEFPGTDETVRRELEDALAA